MDTIRVMIVDDHPTVRRGLVSLLSTYPDIEIVGEFEDGMMALRAAKQQNPDVILLDIQLPGPNGVDIAVQLRQDHPQTKIVILTAFDNDEYLLGALGAGAHAYLLKNSPDDTVVETIRLVHQGKYLLSPSLVDPVVRQLQTFARAHVRREFPLTDEEIQAIRLIAGGATNEELANEMYWSDRTAKRKVEEIIDKLGARNRTQAVAQAIKKGII